jgi:predicted transcriptional regulator
MKRSRLEIIKDILKIIQNSNNSIKQTPLLRKSNVSSSKFREYFLELLEKGFVIESKNKYDEKIVSLTEKGFKFLEEYKTIINFIEEFDL